MKRVSPGRARCAARRPAPSHSDNDEARPPKPARPTTSLRAERRRGWRRHRREHATRHGRGRQEARQLEALAGDREDEKREPPGHDGMDGRADAHSALPMTRQAAPSVSVNVNSAVCRRTRRTSRRAARGCRAGTATARRPPRPRGASRRGRRAAVPRTPTSGRARPRARARSPRRKSRRPSAARAARPRKPRRRERPAEAREPRAGAGEQADEAEDQQRKARERRHRLGPTTFRALARPGRGQNWSVPVYCPRYCPRGRRAASARSGRAA